MAVKENHTLSQDEIDDLDGDMPLDKGIRDYVFKLRSEGIETFESCEGGNGHSFPEPTVCFFGGFYEGYRAVSIAMMYGMPVFSLRRSYSIVDNELAGPIWEMTFRTTALGWISPDDPDK